MDNVRETEAAGADVFFFHGTDSNVKTIIRQLNQNFNFYFYIRSIASEK